MTIVSENTTRKVDSLGRLSIPKSMRDRFNINQNDEIEFGTFNDGGKVYICLSKKDNVSEAEALVERLDALGIEPPDELLEMAGRV